MRADVTAVILAGGAGRRMGGAIKPLIVVDGVAIIARQLAVLAPRVAAVVVAVAPDSEVAWATVPVVRDPVADGGPLAGIAAGLAAATTPWVLAVAGDMPWLAGGVIDLILASCADADTVAVVPRVGGYPEPLVAAYHTRARPAIDAAIARGEKSPSRWLLGAGAVRWIDEPALRAVDGDLRTFSSVNRADDLR